MFAPLALAAQLAAGDPSVPFEKYQLPNGLTVILSEDHRLPQVAVDIWYHVGAANQVPGQERLRAPVRAHDVLGREAHRPRAVPDARGHRHRRRRDGQRHDERGPHQLLRGRPLERASHRALARERPHGVLARHPRREEARRAARRRVERAAPVLREPALRHRRAAHVRHPLPEAAPVLRLRDRHHRRDPERVDGRPARLLPAVLRAEQRVDLHRRQLRSGAGQGAGRPVLRRHPPPARRGAPRRAAAAADGRAQGDHPGPGREDSAARPRLGGGQGLRRRRARGRRARARSSPAARPRACTRSSCRSGSSPRTWTPTTTATCSAASSASR